VKPGQSVKYSISARVFTCVLARRTLRGGLPAATLPQSRPGRLHLTGFFKQRSEPMESTAKPKTRSPLSTRAVALFVNGAVFVFVE
jgi:hypothetical protein